MIVRQHAKKVFTKNLDDKTNGYLIELGKQERFTTSYLTVAYPGCFKGYHAHKIRTSNYVCIKGKLKIILITKHGKEEHILEAENPERLHIPINIPTGILNESNEEAWLINNPIPFYDPELKSEQVDIYSENEAIQWVKNVEGK